MRNDVKGGAVFFGRLPLRVPKYLKRPLTVGSPWCLDTFFTLVAQKLMKKCIFWKNAPQQGVFTWNLFWGRQNCVSRSFEVIGGHQGSLGVIGGHWRSLEVILKVIGGHWRSLEVIGRYWRSFEVTGGHWRSLVGIGGHWKSLEVIGTIS